MLRRVTIWSQKIKPAQRGRELTEGKLMGKGGQKEQTSSYQINTVEGCNV